MTHFTSAGAGPEVVALVPNSGRKILDIGCGTGRLGEALKAHQPAEVIGIELDEAAAAVAPGPRLDAVITSDAEQAVPDFPPASFDAIVCADILEHLRDPGGLLHNPGRIGQASGTVVAGFVQRVTREGEIRRSRIAGYRCHVSASQVNSAREAPLGE